MNTQATKTSASAVKHKSDIADVVREYSPLGEGSVHGVTFDGKLVWFARDGELVCFNPETEKVVKQIPVANAGAGTAFDGTHIYQLAGDVIAVVDPNAGTIVRTIKAPENGASGMAWGDGYLWVGQYRASKIHKMDPKTGEILKTLASDRFVTGVSCTGGALWHGSVGNDKPCELRRLATDGTVEESLEVPVEMISGVESDGQGGFWCGGEKGKLRLIRRRAQ